MPQGFESAAATTESRYNANGSTKGAPGHWIYGRSDSGATTETRIVSISPTCMQVDPDTHRTEVVYTTDNVQTPPFSDDHLANRQAILGMRSTSASANGRYIYIKNPPGEEWKITHVYLSFITTSTMSPFAASVSIVSRDHTIDISSEGSPSMSTFLTEHLPNTMFTAGTNTSLSLSPHYTPTPGSFLVAYVSVHTNSAVFMGGTYTITRRS